MIIVAKKNSYPAEIFAISEVQLGQYPEAEWLHNPPELKALLEDGKATEELAVSTTEVYHQAPDPSEVLAVAKLDKVAAIDARTDELIAAGFTYAGVQFSLSRQAQQNLAGLLTAIAAGFPVAWPKVWNSIDDTATHEVADVSEFQQFYGTAMGTVEAYLNGGTDLKNQVRVASSIEEVEAIIDSR